MKTAIITGAAKGIGKAISERLISEGYFTILVDIDDENGKKLEKEHQNSNITIVISVMKS